MENVAIVLILLIIIGITIQILATFKLLKELKQTNDNLASNNELLAGIKSQIGKIGDIEVDLKKTTESGFTKIDQSLKETIKLD